MPALLKIDRVPFQGILILFSVIAVYYPSMQAGFIWDDDTFFTKNPVMESPDALKRFWMSTDPPDYFPLVSTALWIQRQLWGLEPFGFHLVNIIYHALNSLLFWIVLRQIGFTGAWLAGFIFALHPVHVESVSWTTQIKNVQSTFFYLLAVHFYLRFDLRPKKALFFLSLFFFLFALLSKTSTVMLPLILHLYHWWNRSLPFQKALRRTIPFFVLSAIFSVVTIWYQYQSAGAKGADWNLDFLDRFINAGHNIVFYFSKLMFPVKLTFIYPRWEFEASQWTSWLPHAGLAALLFYCWRNRASWGRNALFGLGFFIISLFPVLGFFNIFFMRYSFVADHWQYIASQGIIALAASSLWKLFHSVSTEFFSRNHSSTVFAGASLVLAGGLAIVTWKQQAIYQNPIVLWEDTLEKNPKAWIAHNNLGNELELKNRMEEAAEHYRETLRIKPDYAQAEDNLGLVLLKRGRIQESVQHFTKAIQLDPKMWEPHNNLGVAYAQLGHLRRAMKYIKTGLDINPKNYPGHNNLALLLEGMGRFQEALDHWKIALNDTKNRPMIHNNIGALFLDQNQIPQAIEHFKKALELKPGSPNAKANLSRAIQRLKESDLKF